MDATCNVQDSIHVFHLVHNMCPGFWVHINVISQARKAFLVEPLFGAHFTLREVGSFRHIVNDDVNS